MMENDLKNLIEEFSKKGKNIDDLSESERK